jgi:ABC-2 type transport system ATP-binding protein
MPDQVLSLDRVSKRFGATDALREVSFSVMRGEMFGLIGPDGAGKTTTIRLLCGLLRPDTGAIRVAGHDPVREHAAITGTLGYFSQRFTLYGDLTIDENLAFFAEIHGVRHYASRRNRLLEMMQLTPFRGRLAERLSGGMKQKLALACTLIHEPAILLIDEPTTGVDPVSRREFWRLLSEFLDQGMTILMATPYLDEAERCARIALMNDGRPLAVDDPSSLRAGFPGQLIEVLCEPMDPATETLRAQASVADVQAFGERLHARLKPGPAGDAVAAIRGELEGKGLKVSSIREIPASLEDVFIGYVTADDRDVHAGHQEAPTPSRPDAGAAS